MKCIIVEDESMAREGMKDLVKMRPELDLLATFDSTEGVLEYITNRDVKLIFLDIELPGKTGTDFAKQLSKEHLIIFTTAFSEYAAESYDIEAIDYLLKPIRIDRFNRAVDRALRSDRLQSKDTSHSREFITVKTQRRYVRIPIADITHIEALKDYMSIYTESHRTVTRMTMKKMESLLPRETFIRVNNSFIVNINKVEAFDNYDLYIGDISIPIGITYRDKIIDMLTSL